MMKRHLPEQESLVVCRHCGGHEAYIWMSCARCGGRGYQTDPAHGGQLVDAARRDVCTECAGNHREIHSADARSA